jgi:peptidoglycan/xylan/chitin deacetylase (PgdA/CDA1 family)
MTIKFDFPFRNQTARGKAREFVEKDSCDFQLSNKYQIYYRYFRPWMPIAVRQMLQRRNRVEISDRWFEPQEFMRSIAECSPSIEAELASIGLWPDDSEFAFVLTHDVETAQGMRHIAKIADFEEGLGFRSSWNLVPYKYQIDTGLVKDLQARGFEIGIHGYNHDGQLYSSRKVFDRRAVEINKAIKKYGAVGFRSPMVHRNLNWLQALEIEYDASCFDIDPFQAAPGGVGSIWPFVAGRIVELPYTLPQDHTLFVALGEVDDRIWKNKLDFIVQHRGMALMLTHPDYMAGRRESNIYFRFLQHVKGVGKFWHATPKDVAGWWRRRRTYGDPAALPANATADSISTPVCD